MTVILHIGAHRCATASFQEYMHRNRDVLRDRGIGHWGPRRLRQGMFDGILPGPAEAAGSTDPRRAAAQLQMQLARCGGQGISQLVVSDADMMGSLRENLHLGTLYCGIGERMVRIARAFDGLVKDVAVNIRSLDSYWASGLAAGLALGGQMPCSSQLQRLVQSPRSWRDVVSDIARAVPDARIRVLPYESFAGRPEAQLAVLTGARVPLRHARSRLRVSPRLEELRGHLDTRAMALLPQGKGCWQPFNAAQAAELRERYADDLMWLQSGADGLAQLLHDPDKLAAGPNPPRMELTRGRPNDHQDRRMAGSG